MKSKKSICVFTHYFSEKRIPLYVQLYVHELQRHFDEILFVTNDREIENIYDIEGKNIQIQKVKNEAYDLGMFYKGFLTLKLENYKTIACINDSNILFGKLDFLFDWANSRRLDFWGLMDSHIKPPFSTHKENYHIQTHFIVFNERAIRYLQNFFSEFDINEYAQSNIKEVRKKVINDWEIGISQLLLSKGLSCSAFVDSKKYHKLYHTPNAVNVSLDLYSEVIQNGVPVIKKKVVFSVKPRDLFSYKRNWKRLIKTYGDKEWQLTSLISELSWLKRKTLTQKLRRRFHS